MRRIGQKLGMIGILGIVSILSLFAVEATPQIDPGLYDFRLNASKDELMSFLVESGYDSTIICNANWEELKPLMWGSQETYDIINRMLDQQYEITRHCNASHAPRFFNHENAYLKRTQCSSPIIKRLCMVHLHNPGVELSELAIGEWIEARFYLFEGRIFAITWQPSWEAWFYWRQVYYNAYEALRQSNEYVENLYEFVDDSTRLMINHDTWISYFDLSLLDEVNTFLEAGLQSDISHLNEVLGRRMLRGWVDRRIPSNYTLPFQPTRPNYDARRDH